MDPNQSQIKVIVLGDTGVGKSSLLLRFVNDQFDQFKSPTLGAAYISKVHSYGSNKSVKYQIWDTAGQEQYKSIAPIYYRESRVALCVYDITNKNSFQVLKNWVEELKSKGPKGLILVVVGNKIDRTDDQQIPYEQAKQYAQSIDAIFKLTSAKQGKGITQLFDMIAIRLQKNKVSNVKQSFRINNDQEFGNKQQKNKKGCCS